MIWYNAIIKRKNEYKMKEKPTSKSSHTRWFHFIGKFALMLGVMAFTTSLADAKEDKKAQKHRGNITAIDMQAKTVTLAKQNGDVKKLEWNDKTELQSAKVKAITDLKPGMWVRCIMVDKSDVIQRIRHEDELDKPEK